ncbi:MAG: hypothetical protein OEY67_07355 [Gammaproteobacteria bacterium]|nr:hypothetical protein [Gammaproteobacteria bacterium]
MTEYVKESLSKREHADTTVRDVLTTPAKPKYSELSHGAWIKKAHETLKMRRLSTPLFALLVVFVFLFIGSLFLFENMDVFTGPLYAAKIAVSSLFAISVGFIMSVWWSTAARLDEKLKEAERLDREYRELLLSFSDSLFDIINALNTLATNPPRPFIVATEFLLGEYIHTLQSQLQRYGDYVAGLGLDATDFLDEKIRIFEGIRERASLSIEGMPKELETLFMERLNIHPDKVAMGTTAHQRELRETLKGLTAEH